MFAAAKGIVCFMLLVFDSVGEGNDGLEPRILVEKPDICQRTQSGILAKTGLHVVGSLHGPPFLLVLEYDVVSSSTLRLPTFTAPRFPR